MPGKFPGGGRVFAAALSRACLGFFLSMTAVVLRSLLYQEAEATFHGCPAMLSTTHTNCKESVFSALKEQDSAFI